MVGLRFAPPEGGHNLIVVPSDSCPEAMEEDNSPKVKEHLCRRNIYVLDEKCHHFNPFVGFRWERPVTRRAELRRS